MTHQIATREAWLEARKALLAEEKAYTPPARRPGREAPRPALGGVEPTISSTPPAGA